MPCLKFLAGRWRTVVVLVVPFAAMPILFIDGSKEMSALYGLVVMASYWISEALPLPVTALLPVVIFPLLGVAPVTTVTRNYIKNASLFGFVCLAFSVCVEKWNLHRRIALKTILLMGSSPKWLMLGFMAPTWFLSLWVNNTSATAMMLPIVSAVLSNLDDIESATANQKDANDDVSRHVALTKIDDGMVKRENPMEKELNEIVKNDTDPGCLLELEMDYRLNRQQDQKRSNMRKAMNICICYASTVGGIGSMVGTSTNVIMQGQTDDFFKYYGLESGVNFLSWMLCCLPISLTCLVVTWVWLVCYFFGLRELLKWEWGDKATSQRTRRTIQAFLDELGPMRFSEKAVLCHFVTLVVLMLSMKLPGGAGWILLFKDGYIKNSVPAVLVLVMTFVFPSQWVRPKHRPDKPSPPLLEWKDLQAKLPWGTVILMGGGYALAFTIKDSGLSEWIGDRLSSMAGSNPPWLVVLLLSLVISFMTEVTSNATTASILCPILAQLAVSLQVHPLYFLFPGVLACSLAFMLPVATPPNTLVFATGDIRVKDMIQAGFFLNIICVGVVNMAANTWMSLYFGLDTIPPQMITTTTTTMMMTTTTTEMTNNLYNTTSWPPSTFGIINGNNITTTTSTFQNLDHNILGLNFTNTSIV